jgi:hypothetical protein
MAATARRIVAAVTLIALLASCTKYVAVPPSDYQNVSGSRPWPCRIETSDGRLITADRFSVVDSTIVVERVVQEGKRVDLKEPLVIPLNDIVSMECAELHRGRSFFALVGIFAVVMFFVGLSTLKISSD